MSDDPRQPFSEIVRRHTYHSAEALLTVRQTASGAEYFRAWLERRYVPPICGTVGFNLVAADYGRTVWRLWPGEHQLNATNTLHGGVAAMLLDSAATSAAHTTLSAREAVTTIQLSLHLVRPVVLDSTEVLCEGRFLDRTRRQTVSEAQLVKDGGKLCAHATATCLVTERSAENG